MIGVLTEVSTCNRAGLLRRDQAISPGVLMIVHRGIWVGAHRPPVRTASAAEIWSGKRSPSRSPISTSRFIFLRCVGRLRSVSAASQGVSHVSQPSSMPSSSDAPFGAGATGAFLSADGRRATAMEIAVTLGFVELGRFSVEYRKTCGESPSKTLHHV